MFFKNYLSICQANKNHVYMLYYQAVGVLFFRTEKHLVNQNRILYFYYLQANTELTLFKNEYNV